MKSSETPYSRSTTIKKTWLKILLIVLVCEKILQHTFVTLAFYNDWGGVRVSVAVNPDVLMVLGGIATILFIISLWGLVSERRWVVSLLIGLALFDILGEFIAQGTLIIAITVSFVVATVLLILTLIYRRYF